MKAGDPMLPPVPRIDEILQHASDGFIAYAPDFTIEYANAAAARLGGMPRETMLGRSIFELYPFTVGSELERLTHRSMQERIPFNFEEHYPALGTWLEVAIWPSDSGGIFVWFHDIMDRKRSEAALRLSEGRFRQVFEQSPLGIALVGRDLCFLQANPAFCRMVGYAEAELVGTAFAAITHPGDIEGNTELAHRLFGGEIPSYQLEKRYVTKQGQTLWVRLTSSLVRDADGTPLHTLSMVEDITQSRRDGDRISSLATAIEQSAEQVVITDVDGFIIYANPAFEAVTGYTREEAIGQNPRILSSGKQERAFYENLWSTIRAGKVWTGEFVNRKKDGSIYYEDATISPITAPSGEISGFVALKRDITGRVDLENQLRQAQKLESIGRLAGSVAHDFNNLLTVINGYSDLLLRKLDDASTLRKPATEIRRAGDRALELTTQLLAFSRKQPVTIQPVDLNQLLTENHGMFERLIGEGITLTMDLAPSLGHVMADGGQLHQVLMNLAANARDAMPDGGMLLVQTALAGYRDAPSLAPGPYVRLTVSDSGTGIGSSDLEHIFEPFFTTKPKGEGTGLGLATVYGIIRQCGGSISVESEPGEGTVFEILLPQVEAETKAPAEPPALDLSLHGSETILVVEDHAEVRNLACTLLVECGYKILEAANGVEAIALAERYSGAIHLLLTDCVMPGITGKALATHFQAVYPATKILYMSGYFSDTVDSSGRLEPAAPYIAKPFLPGALTAKVRDVLGPAVQQARILIVDDEPAIRELFSEILREAGYTVETASNGRQAIESLRRSPVDVLITDLVMPEQEGIETILAIRKETVRPKIVAVSGAFGGAYLQSAKALGAHATLLKPVSASQLLETVRGVLA